MFRYSVLFIAVASALGALAHADEVELQPTVQVTASRVAETVDQTLADVSVITAPTSTPAARATCSTCCASQAGVDLYRTGGAGQQTSLFLRGTNSNQVLVLIDGVRVASANTGAFAFEQLPLDAVERIEIVRGPRASYWGSDAIGGVIQIFTRQLDGPRVAAQLRQLPRCRRQRRHRPLEWRGRLQRAGRRASRRRLLGDQSGHLQRPGRSVLHLQPGRRRLPQHQPRRAAARTRSAASCCRPRCIAARARSQFDQGYLGRDRTDHRRQSRGRAHRHDWNHRLALGHAREDLNTPAFGARYRTRRSSLLWQNEFRLDGQQRLIAGFDYIHDQGETLRHLSPTRRATAESRDDRAVFGGWRAAFGAFDSEVSARHDDNSEFGGATTGSLALGWRASDLARVYASIGQGFRSPTMNELYDPGYGGYFAGNPDLHPERSISSELGVELTPSANQRLKANLYSTRVNDLISFTGAAEPGREHRPRPHRRRRARVTWCIWTPGRHAPVTPGRTPAMPTTTPRCCAARGTSCPPSSSVASANASAPAPKCSTPAARADVGAVELGAYAIVNLRARYTLNPDWSLGARIENLGDRDYALVHGYNTPGRSGYLEVTWQPQG